MHLGHPARKRLSSRGIGSLLLLFMMYEKWNMMPFLEIDSLFLKFLNVSRLTTACTVLEKSLHHPEPEFWLSFLFLLLQFEVKEIPSLLLRWSLSCYTIRNLTPLPHGSWAAPGSNSERRSERQLKGAGFSPPWFGSGLTREKEAFKLSRVMMVHEHA